MLGGAFDPAPTSSTCAIPRAAGVMAAQRRPVPLALARFRVARSDAREVAKRYTFNPLGLDAPLFNPPQPEGEFTHLAEELNVPAMLRRRPLYDELQAHRGALTDAPAPVTSAAVPSSGSVSITTRRRFRRGDPDLPSARLAEPRRTRSRVSAFASRSIPNSED